MTLLMRDQENMEKGVARGILAMVAALKDFNIPDDIILQKYRKNLNFLKKSQRNICKRNG